MKFKHALHTCIASFSGFPSYAHTNYFLVDIFMCSPAGHVEWRLSIIVPDNSITVSFSHQISHHIQMTIPAVFEKQTIAVHSTVFTNTDMPVNRALYQGSSGEEKNLYLMHIYLPPTYVQPRGIYD